MKNGPGLLLWAFAALAFGADDPSDQQARIDAARARLDAAAQELAQLHEQDTFEIALPGPGARASIGVLLMPDGRDRVAVAGVTPDGPAAESGIEVGDALTAVNGNSLSEPGGKPAIERLFAMLEQVEPGDTVRIDYSRDGDSRSADIVAGDPLPVPMTGATFSTMAFVDGPGAPPGFRGRSVIGGVELFDLNADLGPYFGVEDGVLVLNVPPAAAKEGGGLQAGDVITAIDGHTVGTSAACFDALSRATGDVPIEVVRAGVARSVVFAVTGIGPTLLPLPADAMGGAVQVIHRATPVQIDGAQSGRATTPP